MRRVIGFGVLAACGGGSQGMLFDVETEPIQPMSCLAGPPGTADCPWTVVPLEDIGVVAFFRFTTQPIATGMLFQNAEVHAGERGFYGERPTLRLWPSNGGPAIDTVLFGDIIVNVAPYTVLPLMMNGSHTIEDTTSKLSLRFDVIGSQQL